MEHGGYQRYESLICKHHIAWKMMLSSLNNATQVNPVMKEVAKAEVLKLLDVDIIYSIADSKWVSPTLVVPKKSEVIVIRNKDGEKVPTHTATCWHVYLLSKIKQIGKERSFSFTFS